MLQERLAATATVAPAWLLVEHPGPWGAKAPDGVPWPDGLGEELMARTEEFGIRLTLIRRPRRQAGTAVRAILAHTGPERPWLETIELESPEQLLDLDLNPLADGLAPESLPSHEPVFLVCTHGTRDACCARDGRPVAGALADHYPDDTWESTHLGGHRFAANLLCLPDGLLYGRVGPDEVVGIAEAYRGGALDLDHYRGRVSFSGPAQAAEIWLRDRTGSRSVTGVRALAERTQGAATDVELELREGDEAGIWRLRVLAGEGAARVISCGKTTTESPTEYLITNAELAIPAQDAR